ncbi:MAG: isocitrate/isopropylmalate family dehydrogenase [Paracoccaceae bacterium]|nr:isocitrate/isopropylmalate family dehydrogenase [Paracoccaceae bacterium]
MKEINVAVLPGDGIGKEIMDACLKLLDKVQLKVGGYTLQYYIIDAGADFYLRTGIDITDSDFKACGEADAILFGAMGLPDVFFEDGTEIAPHLRIREEYGLFAGVRPVKAFPNTPIMLADKRARNIDFVILRESTEGMFASRGKGEIINDAIARDTMEITRETSEKLFDFAFNLARQRKAKGSKGEVTCVDKSNVFRSFAFFRKIFGERAALNPDIIASHNYVDAQALYLVQRPWDFDVLVMENLLADILSDLGGGLVGGMGMAPCAEIGLAHALFQPAHGSAPTIAGKDKANPTAMFLSSAMMLEWLADQESNQNLQTASSMINYAVEEGFRSLRTQPFEYGGPHGFDQHVNTILNIVDEI